jgi:tRNA A37 N6-isopentenylltransferase MiaA
MIKEGGLEEALTLFDGLSEHNFEKGILQSIGYKEFYEIYQLGEPGRALDFAVRGVPFENSEVVEEGIRQLQAKTMQYAAYQLKWLNSRFGVFPPQWLLKLDLNDKAMYGNAKARALEHIN